MFESPVLETLRKHISRDGAQKHADIIREQSREVVKPIGDAEIMLGFVKLGPYVDMVFQV